ncbi:hypothetical protein HMPREF0649_02188 [Segatella buccae D17]|nr:hypothetical protein HMPREF0649_02188 [Segatella buccae D17]
MWSAARRPAFNPVATQGGTASVPDPFMTGNIHYLYTLKNEYS